jgi:NAD(P)H-hydrate epimerase
MRLSIETHELPARPTVLVVGPGLGKSDAAKAVVATSWADPRPAVFDADALNLLAEAGLVPLDGQGARVLTPHPLEAARLLQTPADVIQADRVGAAERLAARFQGATIVLKGARSLVAQAGHPTVLVDLSEPTLAVGGTGDVLAGLIGGLMAQGVGAREAALCGVWVHGHAGREAGLDRGQRGAFASEIADMIPTVMAHLSHRAAYAGD